MGLMTKNSDTCEFTFPAFLLATHINSWFASLIYVLFDLSEKLGVYFLRQGILFETIVPVNAKLKIKLCIDLF